MGPDHPSGRGARAVVPTARRGLLLAAAALLAGGTGARSQDGSDAAGFVRSLGERAVDLLHRSGDDPEALTRGMAALLDEAVDLDLVARLALGRSWPRASETQRRAYLELCRAYVLDTLAGRLASSTGSERFVVTGARSVGGGDAVVGSRIDHVGYPPLHLEWRVREVGGRPTIADVVVEGVSMVLSVRSEFDAIIARSGIDGLLRELRARVGSDPAGTT